MHQRDRPHAGRNRERHTVDRPRRGDRREGENLARPGLGVMHNAGPGGAEAGRRWECYGHGKIHSDRSIRRIAAAKQHGAAGLRRPALVGRNRGKDRAAAQQVAERRLARVKARRVRQFLLLSLTSATCGKQKHANQRQAAQLT